MCQCQYFSYVISAMSWNSLANVVERGGRMFPAMFYIHDIFVIFKEYSLLRDIHKMSLFPP